MKCLLILAIACCVTSNPLYAQFDITEYKGQSNTEVIENLKVAVSQIDRLEHFSRMFMDDDDKKTVLKEELAPAFRPDTTTGLQVFNEFRNAPLFLDQTIAEKESKLRIDKGDFHESLSGKTYGLRLVPTKIYFYDGTAVSEAIDNIELDLSFAEKIPFSKRIDSISCELRLKYVTAYDKIEVNAQKKEGSYKGKFLKIIKTDKNDIEYIFHKDLDFEVIEGLNATGKVLDDKSHTTKDYGQKDFSIFFALKTALEKIVAAAEKDTSLSREAFQQKYISGIEREMAKIPDSDTMLTTARYHGMIKGLRAFVATERKEKTVSLTIRSRSFEDIHFDMDEEGNACFTDNNGKPIVKLKENLAPVNTYYYEGSKSFFYFNPATKKLEPLPYYSILRLTGNYAAAQEDEKSAYILLNKKKEKVGTFDHAEAYENTVIAQQGNDVLIVTPDDWQVWFRNLDRISAMQNGYAFVQIKGKYGFLDAYGQLVIPAIYDGAVPFDRMDSYSTGDLLFAVKKGDKWGFVDKANKTVIPFDYDEVLPFSYGITMVRKGDNRGLIDTKNNIIAPFTGGASYGLSTNFGKRSYSLGSGKYNHFGKKEKLND